MRKKSTTKKKTTEKKQRKQRVAKVAKGLPPIPTNLASLKNYVVAYFHGLGMMKKDFKFSGTNLHIKDLEFHTERDEERVRVTFQVIYHTSKDRLVKELKAYYDMNNYETVKADLRNIFTQAKSNKYFTEDGIDAKAFHKDKLFEKGWKVVYSRSLSLQK